MTSASPAYANRRSVIAQSHVLIVTVEIAIVSRCTKNKGDMNNASTFSITWNGSCQNGCHSASKTTY